MDEEKQDSHPALDAALVIALERMDDSVFSLKKAVRHALDGAQYLQPEDRVALLDLAKECLNDMEKTMDARMNIIDMLPGDTHGDG